jgi:ABC-2 type transport system ATP-binding protein
MAAIDVQNLSREYRPAGAFRHRHKSRIVKAVQDVSFSVDEGSLFGLLGPNGAGKTTTIQMLVTLLLPTSGQARILGRDVVHDVKEVRGLVGYVFGGDRGLYLRLSARDNMRYFAELYSLPARSQARRIDEMLELVGLKEHAKSRVEGYSRGMRQRLHIARGLLSDPPVIFLDEPTIGVDPVGARALRETIARLTQAGKTVLLTTHYMFEADELCDQVAVISGGRIVAEGTPADLKKSVLVGRVVEIEARDVSQAALTQMQRLPHVDSVDLEQGAEGDLIRIRLGGGLEITSQLLNCLAGNEIIRMLVREPTLEDAYVAIVGSDS